MHISFLAPVALAIALTGCGSIGAIGFPPMKRETAATPPPVDPVAVSPVQSSQLPPIAGAPTSTTPTTGATPTTPGMTAPGTTTTAALNPQPSTPAAGSLGRTDLLGGWTVTSGGESCQLFMTLTSWTGGYRASTRGCNSEPLKSISAWNLNGSQVVLAGAGGSPVATLSSAGSGRFAGQTGQGGTISFFR